MSTQVAHLPKPDKGERYAPAQRDAAFYVYLGAGNQKMTETARLTGIHRNTLMKWADEDDWSGRIEGLGSAAQPALDVVRATFPHLIRAASDRWLKILTDPKANQQAQVKLIELAYGMHGMVVPKQSMAVVQHLTDQGNKTTVSLKDLVTLDPDELDAWTGEGEAEQEGEG